MVSEKFLINNYGKYASVLILVLVEDGFGVSAESRPLRALFRLNPCFSGRWFRSSHMTDNPVREKS